MDTDCIGCIHGTKDGAVFNCAKGFPNRPCPYSPKRDWMKEIYKELKKRDKEIENLKKINREVFQTNKEQYEQLEYERKVVNKLSTNQLEAEKELDEAKEEAEVAIRKWDEERLHRKNLEEKVGEMEAREGPYGNCPQCNGFLLLSDNNPGYKICQDCGKSPEEKKEGG